MNLKVLLIKLKWKPSDILNKIAFKIHGFKYGHRLRTFGLIFIRGTGTLLIGDNVTITSCRETNPIGGDIKTIFHAKGKGKITIGNNVGISNAAIIAQEFITIGDDVLIGGGCKLYDHDFHSIHYENRMKHPDPDVRSSPISIRQGAFIGAHSIILKGVTIGKHSVIGAASVVTKSVPDGEVWAGNPASFIKKIENTVGAEIRENAEESTG